MAGVANRVGASNPSGTSSGAQRVASDMKDDTKKTRCFLAVKSPSIRFGDLIESRKLACVS
jgi:hypothetical protein